MYSPKSDSTTSNPAFSSAVVEMNFLRRHAFGFDDGADLMLSRDADDVIPRFLRAGRPKYFGAARFEPGNKFIEVTVKMVDGFPFDLGGAVSRAPRPALKAAFEFVAFGVIAGQRLLNRIAMVQIRRIDAAPVP